MNQTFPSVSVLIPTLNSMKTLPACLDAINRQRYPKELVEVVIADGGSTDGTVEFARRTGARVVPNTLKTGEAGKAAALAAASNEIVALIDSDNIMVGEDWLLRMVAPYEDAAIVGTEPMSFSAEPQDSLVDRYCALAGVNDPLCLYMGNYDKFSAFTNRWTGLRMKMNDRGDYVEFSLSDDLPTIGANGTTYRREALAFLNAPYFMDIDVPVLIGQRDPSARFAKVRTSVRHLFCADVAQFKLKQTRRIRDFFAKEHREQVERVYPWHRYTKAGILRFLAATVTIVPVAWQALWTYVRTQNRAALFHPVACWLTLYVYATNALFARGKALSRDNWQASAHASNG